MRIVDHPRFAFPAIRLDPEGMPEGATLPHMCGRSGFYIHGGTVSEGCILLQWTEREAIAALVRAGFDTLRVLI